ncbi:uncharacterized protein LOC141632628 [Silene latifolia]|uniref:uncharacterized protein LOC141632628 n=1 Tax=Silene latifolia TaxID=37657 RepID=UPI003D770856
MEPIMRRLLVTNTTAFNFIVSGYRFKVLREINGVVDMEYLKVKVGSLFFVRFFTGTKVKSNKFPVIGNLGLDGEEAKVGSTAVTETLAGEGEVTITGSVVGLMVKMELCNYLRDCIDQHNLVNMNKAFQLYNQDLVYQEVFKRVRVNS